MKSVHAPAPLMKHSLASASSVADVMTKKYVDGLPLARQEKIWAREGVQLSRATMANWVIQCTQTWLKPLYKHMKQQLLAQSVIHADETVVQVLKEDGKPATSESRMWLYASGERSEMPVRIFEYQPDRSGKRPESFLKGFTGCLVTDGYAGYNQVAKVIHCGCWAHYPRKNIIREEWRNALVFRHFSFSSQITIVPLIWKSFFRRVPIWKFQPLKAKKSDIVQRIFSSI